MNAVWCASMMVIAVSGMAVMLMRDKPKTLPEHLYLGGTLASIAGSLFSLAEPVQPDWRVMVFAIGAAVMMAVRAICEALEAHKEHGNDSRPA